jgi:tetratricopeptide (TPR) repeat protein
MDLEWDWTAAEREFQTAIGLSPGQAEVRCSYMLLLLKLGRFTEAKQQVDRALESDPIAPYLRSAVAYLEYYRRNYDAAIEAGRGALELDPNNFEVQGCLGLTGIARNDFEVALSYFEKARELSGGHPLALAFLAYGLAAAQRSNEARTLLNQLLALSANTYISPGYISVIYVGLGEPDEAFKWLDKAFEARDPLLTFLNVLHAFDPLRRDPRFNVLLSRVGLPVSLAA